MSTTAKVPLQAEDALFLYAQTPLLSQQVGAVLLLEPTALDIAEFRAVMAQRVRGVPELRRRLGAAPGKWRRPYWVADNDINITERLREVTPGQDGNPGNATHTVIARRTIHAATRRREIMSYNE